MSFFQAILLGIVQGLTEFLPISSSGHLALGQEILGIEDIGVSFDLLVHGATLLAVLLYFRKRLWELTTTLWRPEAKGDRRMIFLLFLATLPIVAVGLFFKDHLEVVKNHPMAVAGLLCLTGLLLLLPDWLRRGSPPEGSMNPKRSLIMGLAQAFALLPGISRSGSTIALGMIAGVHPAKAAEFSFLMAIPAICGAIVLKSGDLAAIPDGQIGPYLAGMVAAFISGMAAIGGLLACIRRGRFRYFAYYCLFVGVAALIYFSTVA